MALQSYSASGNQLTAEARTFFQMNLIKRTLPYLALLEDAQKQTIPLHTGGFGTGEIQFRRFASLTVSTTALTEGVAPTPANLSVTTVTTKLQQYGGTIQVTDVMAAAGLDNVMEEATRVAGENAGQVLHAVTIAALDSGTTTTATFASGSNVSFGGSATSKATLGTSDVLTATVIKKAVRELKLRNVPPFPDGMYRAVIYPSQAYDLRTQSEWLAPAQYVGGLASKGGPNIITGEIGSLYGVRFREATQMTNGTDAGAGANVPFARGYVYGPDAYGTFDFAAMAMAKVNPDSNLGIQVHVIPPGMERADRADPLGQYGLVAWKVAFAAKVINPDRIQCLYTAYTA